MKSKAEKSSTVTPSPQQQATAQERPFFDQNGTDRFFPSVPYNSLQAKLEVNQPGDKYEKEADRMAEKVVDHAPHSSKTADTCPSCGRTLQRQALQDKGTCSSCGPQVQRKENQEKIQRKAEKEPGTVLPQVQRKAEKEPGSMPPQVQRKAEKDLVQKKALNEQTPPSAAQIAPDLQASKGQGSPLAGAILHEMEMGFDADLSGVRIHTGEAAVRMSKAIQAKAFTHGNDIYFNDGQYNPSTRAGKILLAHEITHTIQQNGVLTKKNDIETTQRPQIQREEEMPEDLKKELEAADQAQKQAIDPGPARAKKKAAENIKTENQQKAQGKHGKKKGSKGKGNTKKAGKGSGKKGKQGAALAANEAAFKKTLGAVGKDLSDASAFACAKADQKSTQLAENEQTHDDAAQKQQQTDAAVVPPAMEGQSQSNSEQVQGLDAAPAPKPDKAAAQATMHRSLEAAMPTNIEEINAFESQGKAQVVGNEILGTVTADVGAVQDGYNDMEQPPAPKPAEVPTELPPQEMAPPTPTLNLGKGAVPNLKPEHTDATAFGQESDDLLSKEGIPEEQLDMVDSGDLGEANKERKSLKKKIKEEPLKIQETAKKETQAVEKNLQQEEAKGKSQMRQKRNAGLNNTKDKQQKTKTALELKREQVTANINGIYERAKKSVTTKLSNLEKDNLTAFDRGQQDASQQFEREVKRDINAWKKERYSGMFGGVKWLKDKFVGIDHFPEVQKALSDGRANYIRRIDQMIVDIDRANQKVIADCKLELANAQKEIQAYVKTLGPELKATGQAALKEMQTKLAEMDKFIDEQKDKLREKLCSKREEAIKKIDEKIEKMKEEMSGLISKLGNLLLEALLKFFKWALEKAGYAPDKLMEIINKGKAVIKAIVTSPGKFFGNLARAVKGGVENFKNNIQQHLIKGVVGWLTGAMSDAGLQLPSQWDIKGIFFLLLQILNLTKDAILKKLALKIGQPIVDGALKMAGFVQRVVSEGPMALWDMLMEQAEMLKEKVMEAIRNWISVEMIKQGVIKLVSMLNPVGAVVQLIIGIYNAVMFFVENWSRIVEFVKTIFSSIADIAMGRLGGAMAAVEKALGMTIPIILNFIARMLGLSGIGKAIRGAIDKIRGPIDKIVDKGLDAVGKVVTAMVNKVKGVFGKGDKKKDGEKEGKDEKDPKAQVNPPSEIGETVPFATEKHSHKLYVKRKGNTYKVIVESTPQEVKDQFDHWRTEIAKEEWKSRPVSKDNIKKAIGRAETALKTVESESALVEKRVENEELPQDKKLKNAEGRLSDNLKIIFQEFDKFEGKGNPDYRIIFAADIMRVHPTVKKEVEKITDKISKDNKGEGLKNIREWSGLFAEIIEKQPIKDLYAQPMGKKGDTGYRGHAYKQVVDMADEAYSLQGAPKAQKDQAKLDALKGVTPGTMVFFGLRDQIFDKNTKGQVDERIEALYNSSGDHTRYHPEKITFDVDGDEFVITYEYKTVPGEKTPTFTVRMSAESIRGGKLVTQTVTGENLALKPPGSRGVTQTSFKKQAAGAQALNSAHIIGDRFMGSGYKDALNLISTSKEFNQGDMARAEDGLAKKIQAVMDKYPNSDVYFTMTVAVTWKTTGDKEVLKKFDELDSTLKQDELEEIHKVLASKQDPRRCESVHYEVDVYKDGAYFDTFNPTKNPIGPDKLIKTKY